MKAKNNQVVRFEIEFYRRKRVLNKHRDSGEASTDNHCQSSGQVRQVEAVRSIPVLLVILQLVMPHSGGNINVYDDASQENENEGNVLSGQVAILSRIGARAQMKFQRQLSRQEKMNQLREESQSSNLQVEEQGPV